MTAHFNKFNLMSKGKDSSHLLSSNSGLKDKSRPHYHCHYANEDKVAPEAFTLDPSLSCRHSTSLIRKHPNKRQRDNSAQSSNQQHSRKSSMNLKI